MDAPMRKVFFGLRQAIRGFRCFRVVHGTVVLSFALAMLMPCMAFSILRELTQHSSPYRVRHGAQTLSASTKLPPQDAVLPFESLFAAEQPIVTLAVDASCEAYVQNPAYDAGDAESPSTTGKARVYVHGVTPAYSEFEVESSVKGRLLNEEDMALARYVCVLGSGAAAKYQVALGDALSINNVPYEVVGIDDSFWQQGSITMPYSRIGDIQSGPLQHRFMVRYERAPDWSALLVRLEEKVGQVLNFKTLQEQHDSFVAGVVRENIDMLKLALITTVIAAANVLLVLRGKIKCAMRSFAVKRAIGAKPSDIFWELLGGNVLQFICSVPFLLLFTELAIAFVPIFRFTRHVAVYGQVVAYGIILCVAVSALLLPGIQRSNAVGILRKGK